MFIVINKIITEDKKKLTEYLKVQLGQKEVKVELIEGTAKVEVESNVFKEIQDKLSSKIKELIPSVKNIEIKKEEKKEASEEKKEEVKKPEVEEKKES